MTGERRTLLEWAWAAVALEEGRCGDGHVVAEFTGGALVAVLDGLGHGIEAAAAADAAARLLAATPGEPLARLAERCHEALRGTRGAVMSLASFDARGGRMTWGGVGNVEAVLLRAQPGAASEGILLRGGIVGYHLPTLHERTLSVARGDLLVMATDGIRDGFADAVARDRAPQEIADAILARHARGTDDALVLVARYLGAGPAEAAGEGAGA